MPLPNDEKIIALSQELIQAFDTIFVLHPGFRPAHAKGVMITGTFTPSAAGATLTRAPHVQQPTPVTVRFSNSTGVPVIPDSDPNASPRGMAIRFHLGEHKHTDIVSHSTDAFPTHTGQEFLEFLRAVAATNADSPKPTPIEAFLGSHPSALAFVMAPKPNPVSFATLPYFGVTAFKFTNKDGVSRYGRYRILPGAGDAYLDAEAAAAKSPNYLFDEIAERVAKGPVKFGIVVQVAEDDDTVDNATIHWPEDRPQVELGTLSLTEVAQSDDPEKARIIFDPIPRVDGLDPSEDPLLELRAAIYLLSGRRRRAATPVAVAQ